jgi:hypothetical protein
MGIIEFRGVTKWFGVGPERKDVLSGIDLSVEDGEFLAIKAEKAAIAKHSVDMVGLSHADPDGTLGQGRVSIPRPRDRKAMNYDATFKRLRAEVTKYLIDVGIAAKVEDSRNLPNVTPIHGTPKAVLGAQVGLIEDRFLDYSQLCKVYPTPKGPLTEGR